MLKRLSNRIRTIDFDSVVPKAIQRSKGQMVGTHKGRGRQRKPEFIPPAAHSRELHECLVVRERLSNRSRTLIADDIVVKAAQ